MPKKTAAPIPQDLPTSRRGSRNGPRELTVTTLYRASVRRDGGEEPVPSLRIAGCWLKLYGLTRGCRVVVSGEPRGSSSSPSPPLQPTRLRREADRPVRRSRRRFTRQLPRVGA